MCRTLPAAVGSPLNVWGWQMKRREFITLLGGTGAGDGPPRRAKTDFSRPPPGTGSVGLTAADSSACVEALVQLAAKNIQRVGNPTQNYALAGHGEQETRPVPRS
jgi:hypothetical protein